MIERARQYGCYGYRRIVATLIDAGRQLNDKRVERLWRREGLKVPMKQPMRSRLWLNDGSCIRLRPQHVDHVWSYDFVHNGKEKGRVYSVALAINPAEIGALSSDNLSGSRGLSPSFGTISKFCTFRIPCRWDAICVQ